MTSRGRRQKTPVRLSQKLVWGGLGVIVIVLILYAVLDAGFRLRDRASFSRAYDSPGATEEDRARARAAIRFRIAQLLRPDEGVGVLSGDRSARFIEIGHLYGRLALLAEAEGDARAKENYMADAIRFLQQGGVRGATEQHVRDTIRKQDLRKKGRVGEQAEADERGMAP